MTLVALNVKTVCCSLARWDMRTPEGVVQDMTSPSVVRWDAGNIYTKSPQFNCMATSGLLHDNLRSAMWVCSVHQHTCQCAQAALNVQYWFITLALCLRAMYVSQFVGLAALQRACDLPGLGVKPQMASCMLMLMLCEGCLSPAQTWPAATKWR